MKKRQQFYRCTIRAGVLWVLSLTLTSLPTQAQTSTPAVQSPVPDYQVINQSRRAFSLPFPTLDREQRDLFADGRQVFQRSWVVGPSSDTDFDGIGPLHSRLACVSCHPNNGRGLAPATDQQRMLSMAVRLSVAGRGEHGEPLPHPVYGDQINEESVPGVVAEARAALLWTETEFRFADGEVAHLRRPDVELRQLAYGDPGAVQLSPRVGPPMPGLGLLERVPVQAVLALAAESKPDGVSGIANQVWDAATQQMQLGRFGFKAGVASVRTQTLQAMHTDLSIRSALFPHDNCTDLQPECQAAALSADADKSAELSDEQLQALVFYLQHLAVPARREMHEAQVIRGEQLFRSSGCVACHREQLPIADGAAGAGVIAAYTDLLVHDMGPGLAVAGEEFLASGRHWRTAPLWGLGLTAVVGDEAQYLHDGRARTLTEAILWHDGEAAVSRQRYVDLPAVDREALLRFLQSL